MTERKLTEPVRRTAWEIQRAVVFALFVRELKTRFGGQWLGVFWVLLEPMAHLAFFIAVFSFIRKSQVSGIDLPLFLITGLIPFLLFRNLVSHVMGAIDSNQGLFAYRQVKPMDAILSRIMLETSIYVVVYAVFVGIFGWLGSQWLPAHPFELILHTIQLVITGAALGLIFAILTDDVPRLRTFVRISMMPLYFISGIVYPVRALPPEILPWVLWNPALHIVELFRGYFFVQYALIPEISAIYVSVFMLVIVAMAMSLYRVRRQRLTAY
jgi:capsular polysaccharide transport system permease protein